MEQSILGSVTITALPGRFPLYRHAFQLVRDPLRVLASLPAYGNIVPIGVGPWQALVICDPELIRRVLVDDRIFDKGGVLADRMREMGGNGIGACPHADHRRQRRLVQPAFHPDRLPGYTDMMPAQVTAVTESWRGGQTIDVLAAMREISTRVACAAMFATEIDASGFAQTARDLDIYMGGVYRRALTPSLVNRLPTPGNRRYDQAIARLRALSANIIAGRRAGDDGNILSMLSAARDSDGHGLSEIELSDQVVTFFVAAVDTTASAMTWALHLLSRHPDIAERVRREADAILGGRAVTAADLPALEFTGRVLTETLRLYPPLWVLTRVTTVDAELGGHHIPAGTTVVCSPYLVQHRPDLYPDPERFDPDRPSDRFPRGAWVPFGSGARKCIGDSFALNEATLVLATLSSRWRFEPGPGSAPRPDLKIMLAPRNLRLRIHPR